MDIASDVSDPKSAHEVVKYVIQKWGTLDILVNNAGGPPPGTFMEHDESAWTKALQQNFLSVVRFSKLAVPHMQKKKWGRIVNISSTIAKEPAPSMVLSASARAAVSAFTKAIATELASSNITVNTILPGGVMTDRATALIEAAAKSENKPFEEVLKRSEDSIPIKRFATPNEIADAALFLISQRGSYLTGISLPVDGGLTKGYF